MNPYEPVPNIVLSASREQRDSRSPEIACVALTAVGNPLAAIAVIWRIDSLILSNMSFWMIIAMFLAVVSALPLGFAVMIVARLTSRIGLGLAPSVLLLLSAFPLTYFAATQVAFARIEGLFLQYSALLLIIGLVPAALGITAYRVTAQLSAKLHGKTATNNPMDPSGGSCVS